MLSRLHICGKQHGILGLRRISSDGLVGRGMVSLLGTALRIAAVAQHLDNHAATPACDASRILAGRWEVPSNPLFPAVKAND